MGKTNSAEKRAKKLEIREEGPIGKEVPGGGGGRVRIVLDYRGKFARKKRPKKKNETNSLWESAEGEQRGQGKGKKKQRSPD